MESNPSRNENEPNGDIPIKLMDCYVCTAADSSLTTFSASCAQSLPQPAFPTLRQGQEVHLYPVRTVLIIYLHTLLLYAAARASSVSTKDLPGPKVFLLSIYYVESLNSSFICNPYVG